MDPVKDPVGDQCEPAAAGEPAAADSGDPVYITAVVLAEDGTIHFAEDIYGHDTEEIAAAVLYLSSDESSFTIGSELIIDGGMATL